MTKDNPGSIHDLIQYLSDKTGIPTHEKIVIKDQSKAGYKSDIIRILNGQQLPQLVKIQRKGNILELTDELTKSMSIPIDTVFDEVYYMKRRFMDSFGIKINNAGTYKMCEGNGWYSNQTLYEVDGKYFTHW